MIEKFQIDLEKGGTIVMPKATTKMSDAELMTITAMAHCGRGSPLSSPSSELSLSVDSLRTVEKKKKSSIFNFQKRFNDIRTKRLKGPDTPRRPGLML